MNLKRLLLGIVFSTSLSATATASNTNLEVSLFYSDAYNSIGNVQVSSEVIGFYRSIDAANELFRENGVRVTLVPAKVSAIDSATYATNYNTWNLLIEMEAGSLESVTDHGHFQVGIARYTHNGNSGYGENMTEFKYMGIASSGGHDFKKIAIKDGILNRYDTDGTKYFMAHELLHTLGGSHDAGDAALFEYMSSGRNYGYGQTCNDGYVSIMDVGFASNPTSQMSQKISGASGCDNGPADMVRLINEYAPAVASHAPYLNMNSLTMSAIENTATSEFELTVQRSVDTSTATTAYIHISGTGASESNEIQPIPVSFTANELAKTVKVPFSSIHPLYNDADGYDGKVYAVAVSPKETVNALTDLSAINTAWSSSNDTDTSDGSDSDGGAGSSGGSVGFLAILAIAFGGITRRTFRKK
ncbi:exported hypothetical protein [Vibrio nigripulchritudo SOn1]|uniref:Uncharacterized protein n=1 Tax=Vibrio nigripulchritudo SOn1 TaxID=1238450 RepID=A0AAV2VIC7_9VIBR|nr:M12 family metallo-peptidase [Vibrio nigripulchritudo]CCO44194.1 exported hypothetical protein [Vibrio nigripulchritudo SOn1]